LEFVMADLSKRGKVGDVYRSGSYKKAAKKGFKTTGISAEKFGKVQTRKGKQLTAGQRAKAGELKDIGTTRWEKGKGVVGPGGKAFTGTVQLASGKTASYFQGRRVGVRAGGKPAGARPSGSGTAKPAATKPKSAAQQTKATGTKPGKSKGGSTYKGGYMFGGGTTRPSKPSMSRPSATRSDKGIGVKTSRQKWWDDPTPGRNAPVADFFARLGRQNPYKQKPKKKTQGPWS